MAMPAPALSPEDLASYNRNGFVLIDTPLTEAELERAETGWDQVSAAQAVEYEGTAKAGYGSRAFVETVAHPFFEQVAKDVLRSPAGAAGSGPLPGFFVFGSIHNTTPYLIELVISGTCRPVQHPNGSDSASAASLPHRRDGDRDAHSRPRAREGPAGVGRRAPRCPADPLRLRGDPAQGPGLHLAVGGEHVQLSSRAACCCATLFAPARACT